MADGGASVPAGDMEVLLRDLRELESAAEGWDEERREALQARVAAVEALNAEAFRRLFRVLRAVEGAGEALREAARDEVVYSVLRRHGILRPSLYERVDEALDSVRPVLASHGGDVELISVEPPRVEVQFLGACDGCPASALTFYGGVRKAVLESVPEITEIVQKRGLGASGESLHFASPFTDWRDQEWSFVCDLGEVSDGGSGIFEFSGHSVLLSRFGEVVSCFENACAHMGLQMDTGEMCEGKITCPHHGFCYDLRTGACLTAPELQLQPHGVRVRDGRIEVRLTR